VPLNQPPFRKLVLLQQNAPGCTTGRTTTGNNIGANPRFFVVTERQMGSLTQHNARPQTRNRSASPPLANRWQSRKFTKHGKMTRSNGL